MTGPRLIDAAKDLDPETAGDKQRQLTGALPGILDRIVDGMRSRERDGLRQSPGNVSDRDAGVNSEEIVGDPPSACCWLGRLAID